MDARPQAAFGPQVRRWSRGSAKTPENRGGSSLNLVGAQILAYRGLSVKLVFIRTAFCRPAKPNLAESPSLRM
jgi:hypothetical protein